jgi:hypothetical protein
MNFERLNQSVSNLQAAADSAVGMLEQAEASGDQAAVNAIADQVNQVATKLSLAVLVAATAPGPAADEPALPEFEQE